MAGTTRDRDPSLHKGLRQAVVAGLGSRDYKSGSTSSTGKVAAGEKKGK